MQQVQLPLQIGQGQALPEHGPLQARLAELRQPGMVAGDAVYAVLQRLQALIRILARGFQLLQIQRCQRVQQPIAPCIAAGEKHHAVRVGCQHGVGRYLPLALQLLQCNFDSYQPKHLAVIGEDCLGKKVACHAGGHANAVKAPRATGQRLLHIGAKAVVLAHIAVDLAPVAGGNGFALKVNQRQRGGLAGAVGLFQLAVEAVHFGGAQGVAQRILELGVQCQHLGQGAVAVNALQQRLGVQIELALHALTLLLQRGAQGNLAGGQHAQQRAKQDDQNSPEQAVANKTHGGVRESGCGRGDGV